MRKACILLFAAVARSQDDDGGGGGSANTEAQEKMCHFTAKDGSVFNLNQLANKHQDFTDTIPGGFTYQFNVCANTNKVCNKQPAPASKWRGGKCNNLGDMETQTVTELDANDPQKGALIKYTEGDICKKQQGGQTLIETRQVSYEIHCDKSKTPGILKEVKEVNMCEYVIVFQSVAGCPVSSGVSRGWVLVLVILITGFLYLAGGIAYKRTKFGMHGAEAIPHVDFWRDVPTLMKDGMQYSFNAVKSKVSRVGNYNKV